MVPSDFFSGSVSAFDASWRTLSEKDRYHFVRGEPHHQVQFAFQNHWRVFRKIIGRRATGRVLEVGCGRGSMAAFFADAGYDVHLIDTSPAAIRLAQRNFLADQLNGHFVVGDALSLPYADNQMDVVVSIGLLEHFKAIDQPVREQIRILRPGGVFLGYVVPEHRFSVQTFAAPVNAVLKMINNRGNPGTPTLRPKARVYRNNYASKHFLALLHDIGVTSCGVYGMFPVPLVSHSITFPFSTMSPRAEARIVRLWQTLLRMRPGCDADDGDPGRDPWTCREAWGLAYLVWATK